MISQKDKVFLYKKNADKIIVGRKILQLCLSFAASYPFGPLKREVIVELVINGKGIQRKPENISEELWKLMMQCWKDNPNARPDFKKLYFKLNCIKLKEDLYGKFETKSLTLFRTEEECEKKSDRDVCKATIFKKLDRGKRLETPAKETSYVNVDSENVSRSHLTEDYQTYGCLGRSLPETCPLELSEFFPRFHSNQKSIYGTEQLDNLSLSIPPALPPRPRLKSFTQSYSLVKNYTKSINFVAEYTRPVDHINLQPYDYIEIPHFRPASKVVPSRSFRSNFNSLDPIHLLTRNRPKSTSFDEFQKTDNQACQNPCIYKTANHSLLPDSASPISIQSFQESKKMSEISHTNEKEKHVNFQKEEFLANNKSSSESTNICDNCLEEKDSCCCYCQ